MSTKYEIEHLRRETIAHFTKLCPSSLDAFDAVFTAEDDGTDLPIQDFDPAAAIVLARETRAEKLLPVAFYRCATLELEEIFGRHYDKRGPCFRLTVADLRTCCIGRECLIKACLEEMWKFLDDTPITDCKQESKCKETIDEFLRAYSWIYYNTDPLCPNDYTYISSELQFCNVCMSHAENSFQIGRRRVWNLLPKYFGLPEWSSLLSDDTTPDA